MTARLAHAARLIGVLIGLIASVGCGAQVRTDAPLATSSDRLFALVGDFPLGQGTSRADYQSFDPAPGRLYIAKMGAGSLLVFDTVHNKLIAERDGLPKVTGILAVPELHRLYASAPGAGLVPLLLVGLGIARLSHGRGAIAILDAADLHEIARLPGGVFPDGIAYDPKVRRIFVSDELGSAMLVIDAVTNRMVARIDAGGEVGNVRYDPVTAKIYVPIQSRDDLLVIDPVNTTVVTRFALPGGRHPHGLAIAPGATIGYIACDGDDKLLTVDLVSGKMLDRKPLGHNPDVLAIDPDQRRLYVTSESGNLSSFDIMTERTPASLGDVFVGENAHSVALDPKSHRLYIRWLM